jgi:hypothetical protein
VANGDTDGDGCCDAVDKWRNDPKRGCECCDYEAAWRDSGGDDLKAEWVRIVGGNGPLSQWIVFSTGSGKWESTAPAGEPSMIGVNLPWRQVSGNLISDRYLYIPVTVTQLGSYLDNLSNGGGQWVTRLQPVESFRVWMRAALAWLFGLKLLTVLFREMRV